MTEATAPLRTYFFVAGALFVLLAVTVGVSFIPLGPLSVAVSILIAGTKAALIILFFMHVRYSSRVTQVFALAGFFWLIILFLLTYSDYLTRG